MTIKTAVSVFHALGYELDCNLRLIGKYATSYEVTSVVPTINQEYDEKYGQAA